MLTLHEKLALAVHHGKHVCAPLGPAYCRLPWICTNRLLTK